MATTNAKAPNVTKRSGLFRLCSEYLPAKVRCRFIATAITGTTANTLNTVLTLGIHAGTGAP